MREVAPYYEENMKMFGELRLVRALTDARSRRCATPACRHRQIAEDRGCGEGRRASSPAGRRTSSSS
jgi:hypothetical protein